MDVQHGHARSFCLVTPLGVMQRKHLYAAAAIAFYTVAGAADDQQVLGVTRSIERHVHRQYLAIAARQWVVE